MSCAACAARVEKAVSAVDGVTGCSVSLLTNSMGVEGSADDSTIIRAVEQAGYGAKSKSQAETQKGNSIQAEAEALEDHETPRLKKRLIASVCVLTVLMYFSMGHMMWGWPLPSFFDGNHVAMGLVQLLLTIIVMLINKKFFVSGFRSVMHGAPNMDTLVGMGSAVSFLWSVYVLFAMTDAQVHGGTEAAAGWMHQFYFESAAMILTLITVGKMLEARSKGKTTDALKGLMKLAPKTAVLVRDGQEVTVPIEEVQIGDIFAVRPGEAIPVDGIVLEGSTAVNESALTGESVPVDKQAGDEVRAATLNQSGFIQCRAERVGEDTTLSQIIRMVSDAAATKAPIAKIADRVSGIFVPVVIGIAVFTTLIWLLIGKDVGFALARGISVLVISCPCALGLATPVAIMVGSGVGARHGILFKTSVALEETGKADIVVLDKTGTITRGEPAVTDVYPVSMEEGQFLALAKALEARSEHPLAKAIVRYETDGIAGDMDIQDFQVLPGNGLMGTVNGRPVHAGSLKFISGIYAVDKGIRETCDRYAREGKTPLLFGMDRQILGVIAVADTIKEDSVEAIRQMKGMGLHTVMLTGDNQITADAIGTQVGVDEVVAGVLPDGKEQVIRQLQEHGHVIMVGDGINDAPALTRAEIGMAIGAGTDIAMDAADLVLMNSRLTDATAAIRLSRFTIRNIHENLFWAFIYNIIGIPLAAGAFISLFGWELNPMFGAAAMSLSSFCVVSNALRLNFKDIYASGRDRSRKNGLEGKRLLADSASGENQEQLEERQEKQTERKDNQMTKTMKIDGMMCEHCEATVKKALEKLEGVQEAVVSHVQGTAVVTLSDSVADDVLKKAVEDKDYTVKSIA